MSRLGIVLLLALAACAVAASARAADIPEPEPPPPVPVIADGVRIGGLDVGGLARWDAYAAVEASFARRVQLVFKQRTLRAYPAGSLGAGAKSWRAVDRALAAAPDTDIRLGVTFERGKAKRYVARLAKRLDRAPRNAEVRLQHLRPRITKAKDGRRILRYRLRVALRRAIWRHERGPVAIETEPVKPSVTRRSYGPIIVIRRGSKRLYLYQRTRFRTSFGVATGLPQYPTPLGRFSIVTMQRHPWWYPPDADWAAGASPIPPGPGNPLGTRWMGLSVGGVGIHGTPDAASIGYSASHGCIRMRIPDAEWLFEHVRVGAPVFIVGA